MKKLTLDGRVVIVTNPSVPPSQYVLKFRDPWRSHGFPDDNFIDNLTALGFDTLAYHMGSVDGPRYYYLWGPAASGDTTLNLYNAWQAYTTPGVGGFHEGEAFNYFVKPLVVNKFTEDEYFDYLDSH